MTATENASALVRRLHPVVGWLCQPSRHRCNVAPFVLDVAFDDVWYQGNMLTGSLNTCLQHAEAGARARRIGHFGPNNGWLRNLIERVRKDDFGFDEYDGGTLGSGSRPFAYQCDTTSLLVVWCRDALGWKWVRVVAERMKVRGPTVPIPTLGFSLSRLCLIDMVAAQATAFAVFSEEIRQLMPAYPDEWAVPLNDAIHRFDRLPWLTYADRIEEDGREADARAIRTILQT